MPQSLSAVYLHLVFSTKHRTAWLGDREMREQMHAYLGGVSGRLDCPALVVGGVDDHVHVLARLGRTITQANWIKEVKRVSSAWASEVEPGWGDFCWQRGYGVFSVSASGVEEVRRYIVNQEARHRKLSFQDEMRILYRRYGMEWDERYVWD